MKHALPISALAIVVFLVSLFMVLCFVNPDFPKAEESADEFCASVITTGLDGNYLLNLTMLTGNNTDQVNRCIKRVGIKNVDIARNISDLLSPGA